MRYHMKKWKPVKDFPNYMISEYGEIVNVRRDAPIKNCKISGRYCAVLYKDGVQHMTTVARLLAEAFIPRPEGTNCVKYKDGNKENLHLSNLYWTTSNEYWSVANSHRRKTIVCVETGEKFDSVKSCAEATGYSYKKIKKSIREGTAAEKKKPGRGGGQILHSLHFIEE